MISAYDQPAQFQAVDTYVPIPFQELMAAGMQKQKQYEEAETLTNKVFEDLDSQTGLKQISVPGSDSPIEVGDYARVEAKKNYYSSAIDELVMNTPDKGSPLYRTKMTNLLRQMRKDLSPQGVFGSARANYETYLQMQKDIRGSEDAAANPYLLAGKRQELMDFAKRSKEGVYNLSNMSTIGKDPELNKQLVDVLDNMKADLSTQLQEDLRAGVIRKNEYEGIAYNKAYTNALNTILTTPKIVHALQQQAQWERDVNGNPVDVEQAAKNLASNMANVFAYGKSTKDIKLDSGWAKMQQENTPTGLEMPVNYNLPGSGYSSYSSIEDSISKGIDETRNIDNKIRLYETLLLENSEAVTIDPQADAKIPVKDLLDRAKDEKAQISNRLQEARLFAQQADRFGGLADDQITESERETAYLKAAEHISGRKTKVENLSRDEQEFVLREWKTFVPGFSQKKEARDRFIDDANKTRTVNTNIIVPSKSEIATYDADGFKTLALKGNLKYAESTEGKIGEITLDEKEKIDPTKSVFLGRGISKDDGNFEYFYATYDKDGKKVADVRVPGSKLDELNLARKGQLELPGQGLRGMSERISSVLSSTKGYGDMSFTSGSGKALNITIARPATEGGTYRVLLPKADGTKQVQEFTDEQAMHEYVYNLEQNLKNK